MWDGQGTYMNLMPLLWVPYHMTLINQHSFNLGLIQMYGTLGHTMTQ